MLANKTILAPLFAILPLVTASPTVRNQKRTETCIDTGSDPWFINSQSQTDCLAPPVYPTVESGAPPGVSATCEPLDPAGLASYVAASVNLPCSDYPFIVYLYATDDCTDTEPISVSTSVDGPQCIVAPEGMPFLKYSAYPVVAP